MVGVTFGGQFPPASPAAAAEAAAAGDRAEAAAARPANLAHYGWASLVALANPADRQDLTAWLRGTNRTPIALPSGAALLLEWNHPRPVRAVTLRTGGEVVPADAFSLEWWHRVWPDNGTGGWMKLDDPFNGDWTSARLDRAAHGDEVRLAFAPLTTNEVRGVRNAGFPFRQTYKLRLTTRQTLRLADLTVHSDAVLRRARLRFEWGLKTTVPGTWQPTFEARNGRLVAVTRDSPTTATVDVEYADAPDRLSPDRGLVVFRSGETRSFSVFVDDVLREGGLFVRDIGAFVSDAANGWTHATWPGPPGEVWHEGTVIEQVARRPEQSFEQVSQAIPRKPPAYLFLGLPNLRQEFALLPQGQVVLRADSLRAPGPDAELRPWTGDELVFDFGTGERPLMGPQRPRTVRRTLEDGWLPVVRHEWEDGGIRYTQTSVATLLGRDLATLDTARGTEPVVLATRFEFENRADTPRPVWLWLEISREVPCRLSVDNTLLLAHASDRRLRSGVVPVRGHFRVPGKGTLEVAVLEPGGPGSFNPALEQSAAARPALRYYLELGPRERQALEFFAPYIELLDPQELIALKSLSFSQVHDAVVPYWRQRAARGMTYEVPDRYLNEFFKANLWHVLVSTDRDPVTGQYQHGAATHQYRSFLNETMMVARSLEMRGEHTAARQLIETFLANQGVKGLPGNFRSSTGVLYAAHPVEPDPYTAQGYNMHHGWAMAAAAQHYRWTRDLDCLLEWGPRLSLAADWITRERQATCFLHPDGSRPVEYGLAPAGDLEDVEEYLYFYATDAYYHQGMAAVVDAFALASLDPRLPQPPEPPPGPTPSAPPVSLAEQFRLAASSLGRDTTAFRADLRASVAESVATSPVVRLRDGTWVPYVPPRAYALTHRKEGWIREALYPALHLVNGGVYDSRHPFVEWLAQDLEDNLFLSAESGYGIEQPRTNFFHLGGFTLQPNLLDLALVYLETDRIPNFLRAFYNTAWASLYPDTMCFAEWVPEYGKGGGPLYKTPDECKFIQWMRHLLIFERGDALELGLGVPRAWMADGQRVRVERAATYFGPLDLTLESRVAQAAIHASIRLRPHTQPGAVRLRLRHPDGRLLRSATSNGKPAPIDATRQIIELPVTDSAWQVNATF